MRLPKADRPKPVAGEAARLSEALGSSGQITSMVPVTTWPFIPYDQ